MKDLTFWYEIKNDGTKTLLAEHQDYHHICQQARDFSKQSPTEWITVYRVTFNGLRASRLRFVRGVPILGSNGYVHETKG